MRTFFTDVLIHPSAAADAAVRCAASLRTFSGTTDPISTPTRIFSPQRSPGVDPEPS